LEYLDRIARATETAATISANPHLRHRAAAGLSPLLDMMRRIAVALATAEVPTTASTLTLKYLSKPQRPLLEPALEEGVKLGAFTSTGGVTMRGVKYLLADPTPLGITLEEIHARVEVNLRAREDRRRAVPIG
jgi:hypothetical protein